MPLHALLRNDELTLAVSNIYNQRPFDTSGLGTSMNLQHQHDDCEFMAIAATSFAEHGLRAVTIAQIADLTSRSESDIFAVYKNRLGLFVAVFDWYLSNVLTVRIGQLEAEFSPADAIVALLEEAVGSRLSNAASTPYRLLEVALGISVRHDAIRDAVSAALGETEAFFYRCILGAQHLGHFTDRRRPEDLARFVLGMFVSTYALAHIHPGRNPVEGVIRPILTMLRA